MCDTFNIFEFLYLHYTIDNINHDCSFEIFQTLFRFEKNFFFCVTNKFFPASRKCYIRFTRVFYSDNLKITDYYNRSADVSFVYI